MMVSPSTPALSRTRCQISSVMNGAMGCSARSSASSVAISVDRVPRSPPRRRVGLQHRLRQFEVPVAEFAPGEFVERIRDDVEAVVPETRFDAREHRGEARADPAVGEAELGSPQCAPRGEAGPALRRSSARSAPHSTVCCRSSGCPPLSPCRSAGPGSASRAMRKSGATHPCRRRGSPSGNCLRVAFSIAGRICGCIKPLVRLAMSSSSDIPSTMSSGSITLPLDLDIFWPSWSRIRPCTYTSRNGTCE